MLEIDLQPDQSRFENVPGEEPENGQTEDSRPFAEPDGGCQQRGDGRNGEQRRRGLEQPR